MLLIIIKFKVGKEKHEFFMLTNTRGYSAGSFLSCIFSEFLFIMTLIFLFTQIFSFHIKRNEAAEEFPCVVIRQWNNNLIQKRCLLCPRDLQVTKCIQLERHIQITVLKFRAPQENAVNLTSSHNLQPSFPHEGKIKLQITLCF